MIPLNFPDAPFKFGIASTKPNIYDITRRKYVHPRGMGSASMCDPVADQ